MAKWDFKGVDKLLEQYQRLYDGSDEMIGKAIYNGANVAMKAFVSAIEGLKTDDRYGTPENPTMGPSTYQKEGLLRSVGIAPMRWDGNFCNVKIGFDGYNGLHTKTWPQGQPNQMVARAVESGTSWMRKQPFTRKAARNSKKACEEAMAQTIDKEIQRRMGK